MRQAERNAESEKKEEKSKGKKDRGKNVEKNEPKSDAEKAISAFENQINVLKGAVVVLKDSIKALEKNAGGLNKNIESMMKETTKQTESREYAEYCRLIDKRDSLIALVKRREDAIKRMDVSIKNVEKDISDKRKQVESLDNFADEKSKAFISDNEKYLKVSLRDVNVDKLREIGSECGKYAGVNSAMSNFSKRIEGLLIVKQSYSKAKALLDRPYDKVGINEMMKQLRINMIKCYTEDQKSEVKDMVTKLNCYHKGVDVFCRFVDAYNHERGRNNKYHDVLHELNKDARCKEYASGIETYINVVPYLKKCFDKYLDNLTANFETAYSGKAEDVMKELEVVANGNK